MQKRRFGKTNFEVSALGFGGFHLLEIPQSEVSYLLNSYLDQGGNYIETAASYGNGESEKKIGNAVAHRRSEFFLTTKSGQRDKLSFEKELNESLKNLKTEYVDLIIYHAVATEEDLEMIFATNGAHEAAIKAQKEGKVKYIGISMHGHPFTLLKALDIYSFDAVMAVFNYYDRFNFPSLENELLPKAIKNDVGIIAMKPFADGYLYRSIEKALRYTLSLPVSVVVAGINSREMLKTDINIVNNFVPMTAEEKNGLFSTAKELSNYVCRQCNLCMPCPQGINIPYLFELEGYYDRQMFRGKPNDTAEYNISERLKFWFGNQGLASKLYSKVTKKARDCNQCGECQPRCPYGIDIINKLRLVDYKLGEAGIF
ncbi:aldo/keto reductase [Caldicellulosiruptoraceae bacterium PP1]